MVNISRAELTGYDNLVEPFDRSNPEQVASLVRFYQRNWQSMHEWLYAPEEIPDESSLKEIIASDNSQDRPSAAIFDDGGEIRAFAFAHKIDEEERQQWDYYLLRDFMQSSNVYSISYMRDQTDESSKGLVKDNLAEMSDIICESIDDERNNILLLSIVDTDNQPSINVMERMVECGRAGKLCDAHRGEELKAVYIIL